MYWRIYRVSTDDTIMVIKAKDWIEASVLTGKLYGADNADVEVEKYEELNRRMA